MLYVKHVGVFLSRASCFLYVPRWFAHERNASRNRSYLFYSLTAQLHPAVVGPTRVIKSRSMLVSGIYPDDLLRYTIIVEQDIS